MHQERKSKSSNLLYYSNASRIEESRRYLVTKGGGLAWLLWQGGVVNTVVDRGNTINNRANKATQIITRQCVVLGVT